ncbi:hypothetical protein WBJ53_05395 [Spirosoma sp. SC4-14]|uniref:hypothetical protein n=1 Tax=Spirosoma sp. SC4-14 TaxID=3128900 RepID=UPI0030CDE6A4
MKTSFFLMAVLATCLLVAQKAFAFEMVIEGNHYTDGQTAFIDCSKSSVEIFTYQEYPQPDLNVVWGASPNFSQTEHIVESDIILTLDPSHNDGWVTMNVSGNGTITVYITQIPPRPTLTATPTVCSGQNGTFSASLSYGGTSSASLIWRTTGGITVNSGTSYTDNSTNSSVTLHNSSYGTYSVSGLITGCSNLEGPAVTGYIGAPGSSNITFSATGGADPGSSLCNGSTWNFQANPNLPLSQYSYSWSIPTGSSNVNYFYSYGPNATITAGSSGTGFVLEMDVTYSGCGSSGGSSRTFFITSCGGGYYRIANNPANDKVTALFEPSDDSQALPIALQLSSEKNGTVKEIKVRGQYADQAVKNGLQVDIDVHSLPRGTYYLQGIYEVGKAESVRIILQ